MITVPIAANISTCMLLPVLANVVEVKASPAAAATGCTEG